MTKAVKQHLKRQADPGTKGDGRNTRLKKGEKGDTPKDKTARQMNRSIWYTKYGTKKVNGQDIQLCWFHIHLDRGCTASPCSKSHTEFPAFYGGKKWQDLSETKHKKVLADCE